MSVKIGKQDTYLYKYYKSICYILETFFIFLLLLFYSFSRNLKEKGFYSNIMGTSAVFSIFCDSINFDKDKMEFTYYGRQRIERRTSILMRELVTAGQLKRVPRTDNNPHGLLITNWRTLLNKDIEQKTKNSY